MFEVLNGYSIAAVIYETVHTILLVSCRIKPKKVKNTLAFGVFKKVHNYIVEYNIGILTVDKL